MCQAESACAMLGLRLARIDINNFMDATNAAFKCSGPFSQTWIKSWNGDEYGNKGIVLSTGSAAPGGAVNEVFDSEFGRNVLGYKDAHSTEMNPATEFPVIDIM